jgi:hypothetical protein
MYFLLLQIPSLLIILYYLWYSKSNNIILQHYPKYKREEMCREILERHFNKPFPRVRPDFLKNPYTLRNLELDCYNDELKIALEYCGYQHYNYPNPFHKSKEEFEKLKERDKYKINTCKRLGIKLIIVPYWISDSELKDYILSQIYNS